MAEINRKDIISDEALQAPLTLAENFDKAVMAANRLIAVSEKSEAAINGNSGSTSKLAKDTQTLTAAQTELEKIQKQFATSTQRLSDEYISNKRALNAVNEEVKNKLALGERDARAVTAQTASLKQLEAALNVNKKAYSELSSEQSRNSKEGQELLKIIQNQDKQHKELSKSIGNNRVEVGNYSIAMNALDQRLGGLISSLKEVGMSFKALFTNAYVVALAALAAAFYALKDAAKTYYETTLEGEEAQAAAQRQSQAFMDIYKDKWAALGEATVGTWDKIKNAWRNFLFVISPNDVKQKINDTQIEIAKISERVAALQKDHIRDIVDDSATELKVNELLERSKDKLHVNDMERLKAAREAKRLLNEQLAGDLILAKNDLELQRDIVETQSKINGGTYDRAKSVAELSDNEINAIMVKGDEIKKLAQLEIAYNKISEDAITKRIGFNKVENAVVQEIEADRLKALAERTKAEENAAKIKDKLIKNEIQSEKDFQNDVMAGFKDAEGRRIAQAKEELERVFEVQQSMQGQSLQSQLDYLQKILDTGKFFGDEKVAVEKAIAKLQLAVIKENNDDKVKAEEELHAALQKLQQQAFATGHDLIANFYDAEAMDADARRAKLEKDKAAELTAVGNNADAKAAIDSKYAKKLNDIENEQRKIKRERAIADKAFTAFEIGINTARAVIEVLPNIPLSIAIGAIGALQLAAVLTKPIPQFKFGTKSSPAGPAIVGEEGAELMREPGGRWKLTPHTASMVNLVKGTEIIPHNTSKALAMASLQQERMVDHGNGMLYKKLDDLERALVKADEKVVNAIVESQTNFFMQGSILYNAKKSADGSVKIIRQQAMGY